MNRMLPQPTGDLARFRRSPDQVMTLARMGAAHPTRLSFLRQLLRRMESEGWRFDRPVWDAQGLLGETPLWGRFWENPQLTAAQAALLTQARDHALARLSALKGADYGLIHADLVQENVLIGPGGPHLIDFDDGGFGYRLFDMATVLNFILREADPAPLQAAFVQVIWRPALSI